MPETIGFIGLGVMGAPMARNLLAAGHDLVVHSRSPEPVEALAGEGAQAAGTPSEVAQRSDVVITMLPDSPAVEAVVLGEGGVLDAVERLGYDGCIGLEYNPTTAATEDSFGWLPAQRAA